MTTIRLGVLHPTGAATDARSTGSLEWEPTARRTVGANVVLPEPFSVVLSASEDVTRTVDPTSSAWVWKVLERVPGGANTWRYLAVPDSLTTLDYAALVEVDPATLDPVAVPEAAWWAANDGKAAITEPLAVKLAGDLSGTVAAPTVAKIGGVAVGNAATKNVGTTTGTVAAGDDSRLSDARTPTAHNQAASTISDSTATGRSVLTAADAATARTAIGAASIRWDQTAGRAAYAWDTINGRDQVIYYDSGWRTVLEWNSSGVFSVGTGFGAACWVPRAGIAGFIQVRRYNDLVSVVLSNIALGSAAGSADSIYALPTGFHADPTTNPLVSGSNAAIGVAVKMFPLAVGWTICRGSVGTAAGDYIYAAQFSFSTSNAVPATLPGVAYGTIPNV